LNCLFCKIVAGEIPASKVFENEHCYAFLDINPVRKGHTLVIPKKHYENVLDIPSEDLCNLMPSIQKVAKAVKTAAKADAFNLTTNNGKEAGQAILHLHFHIIPRNEGDGLPNWPHEGSTPEELEQMASLITKNLF